MNSRETGNTKRALGSGRSARLRRRRRKRIALFASFAVIIVLIVLAVVLLALEIAEASEKLRALDPAETSTTPADTSVDPVVNYVAAEGAHSVNEGTLILVNSEHAYVFPSTQTRLMNIYNSRAKNSDGNYSYQCSFNDILMDKTALTALNKFLDAFYSATGNEYALVSDAYRDFETQEQKSSNIKAGYSDHHTGYLVSIKFYENGISYTSDNSTKFSDAYAWLAENAAKYGFVRRYPSDKSTATGVSDYTYCYRYVGRAHSAYMSANNLCFEEYVSLIKTSYAFGVGHLITDADGVDYEVYYVPKTGDNTVINVPENGNFEISGDNSGGYIVTVTLG